MVSTFKSYSHSNKKWPLIDLIVWDTSSQNYFKAFIAPNTIYWQPDKITMKHFKVYEGNKNILQHYMEIENITALRGDISGGEKAAVTQLRIERLEALGTRHSPASPPASLILPIVLSASLPPPVSSLLDTPLYHFHLASCSLLIRATISIYALQKANRWKDYMSPFLQNLFAQKQ